MASRTRKSANQQSSSSTVPTKRRRLQASESPGSNQSGEMSISEAPPRMTYPETVAALEKMPLISLHEAYKEWKKSGAGHDTYCRVCHRSGRLQHCVTCKLSFHSTCMPQGWIQDSSKKWYCPICVENKWHISPPKVTPPSSPEPTPAQVHSEGHNTAPPGFGDRDDNVPSASPHASAAIPRRDTERLFPHSISPPLGEPNIHSSTPTPQQLGEDSTSQQNVTDDHPSSVHNERGAEISEEPRKVPHTSRRPRKSRFSTFSDEVDASLGVLYRELASISALKEQIEGLRMEKTRHLQMIQIRDQNITSLRRQIDSQNISSSEIERLRAGAVEQAKTSVELRELREKCSSLESELESLREDSARTTETMNEWKSKLAQLLNP